LRAVFSRGSNNRLRPRGARTDCFWRKARETNNTRQRRADAGEAELTRQRGDDLRDAGPTRQRGSYIPAAERREVFQRDGGRCTYVDLRGERCCETRFLELHHLEPFAKGGASVASNLTLRCAAHNALAAEQDFGSEIIAAKRDAPRHESLASQVDAFTKG
jgi:hypothetical protein